MRFEHNIAHNNNNNNKYEAKLVELTAARNSERKQKWYCPFVNLRVARAELAAQRRSTELPFVQYTGAYTWTFKQILKVYMHDHEKVQQGIPWQTGNLFCVQKRNKKYNDFCT